MNYSENLQTENKISRKKKSFVMDKKRKELQYELQNNFHDKIGG